MILAEPLHASDADTIQQVGETLKAQGSALHERLSVFWGTPSTLGGQQAGGRFPPLDRLDLIQHGLLIDGRDTRRDLPQPSRVDLLVAGADFALDFLAGIRPTGGHSGSPDSAQDDAAEQIRRPEVLLARGIRRVTKLVLFPVRFLYSAETGLVGTNHAAVDYYLACDQAPGAGLVAAALAWRANPPDRIEAMTLLKKGMIPLYVHYIDDHIARLTGAGRLDLVDAFAEWLQRITDA